MGSLAASHNPPPEWTPRASTWDSPVHPLINVIREENNAWFLQHWPFPSKKAEEKFVGTLFELLCSVWFPLAKDERLKTASKLIIILFLIDDALEDLSFVDGEKYNNRLMEIALRQVDHDPSIPLEYMWHEIWESMSAQDSDLAEAVKEPVFVFLRCTTDKERGRESDLGGYLVYREKDVGQGLLAALVRFTMGISLTPSDFASIPAIDKNSARHIGTINDIYSWEKEYRKSIETPEEGAILSNAVQVFADETKIPYPAAKNVLLALSREWENVHDALCFELVGSKEGASPALRDYLKGLQYVMSGNEHWCLKTPRYTDL